MLLLLPPESTLRVSKREHELSRAAYVEGILKGDRAVLARAITLVESSRAIDRQIADDVLGKCLPASGKSIRVGVTGIPGGGKSSLIEALGKHLIGERGEKVAVLAIDPSSQFSGGSILGDKTRMTFLASSDKAFIRPSPSRSSHGGVAQNTRDVILLCEAAGYRNIFVETIGVGQAETAVRDMVDFLMLVTLAGTGNELQGIKRGLMEMADVVVVNKADGDNIGPAENARADAESALQLLPRSPSGWTPHAMTSSAHTSRGVVDLWSCIRKHEAMTKSAGWFEQIRREQSLRAMDGNIEVRLLQMFRANPEVQQRLPDIQMRVLAGKMTAGCAVRELLSVFTSK